MRRRDYDVGGQAVSGRRTAVALAACLAGVVAFALTIETARGGDRHDAWLSDRARAANAIRDTFRPELRPCMLRIVDRETGGTFNPRAANWRDHHSDGSRGSFGLFQAGAVHRREGETIAHFAQRMYRPLEAARFARILYRRSGLAPWGGTCG